MLSLYLLTALACAVNALHNVTVDDTDPQIIYTPPQSWVTSANNSLDIGGAHKLTQDPTATAKFVFTGVAIYFLSPRWPYSVNTQIALDSGPSVLVDLVDHSRPGTLEGPETVQSQVVWNATGLANVQHTLLVSVGQGQPYGVVDALIYTSVDPGDVSSSSSSGPTSTSSRTSTSAHTGTSTTSSGGAHTGSATDDTSTSSSKHVLPIILGTVLGVAALSIIVIGLFFLCRRRRNRPASEAWTVAGNSNPTLPNMSASPFVPYSPNEPYSGHYHDSEPWQPHPYANPSLSPIPGAMAPATAAALMRRHSGSQAGDQAWQGTTGQMTEQFNNRVPERYHPSPLWTITETSPQPTITTLANSPSSQQTDIRDMAAHVNNDIPLPPVPRGGEGASTNGGGWKEGEGHPYSRGPPAYTA